MSVISGDTYELGLTAIITVVMQLFFFAIAYWFQFDKVTDFAGSANFLLIAGLTYGLGPAPHSARQAVATALVLASKAYLGLYLLYRVLARGKDARFDAIRERFWAFLGFWVFQMIWAWGVSLPLLFINGSAAQPDLGAADAVGIALFVLGLLLEVVGDLQKDRFRADAANAAWFCDVGLWSVSRHPNFFGEIAMWWGVFVMAVPVAQAPDALWSVGAGVVLALVGPLLTMVILLFLSGMPTAEGESQRRFLRNAEVRVAFLRYRAATSPLVPLPPALYRALPLWVKRLFLFEWPMYETSWELDEPNSSALEGGPAAAGDGAARAPGRLAAVSAVDSTPFIGGPPQL